MKPALIRRTLGKRRAYLLAKLEQEPTPARHYLVDELEALNAVLAMVEAVAGPTSPVALARDQHAFERVREQLAEPRCTCERCPIHGGSKR
jgi:hypothetical protein